MNFAAHKFPSTPTIISDNGKLCSLTLPFVHSFNSSGYPRGGRDKKGRRISRYSHRATPRAAGSLYHRNRKNTLLTVELRCPHGHDLVHTLESFFGGLLVLVACPCLQPYFHVGRAAHLAAAPHAAAYFKLFRYTNKRKRHGLVENILTRQRGDWHVRQDSRNFVARSKARWHIHFSILSLIFSWSCRTWQDAKRCLL